MVATKTDTNRQSLYAEVTARMIAEMGQGRLPWVQPWDGAACACTMPHNAGSGRFYSEINALILWSAVIEGGYSTQRWLTYRQAQALAGHVRRREAGVTVCYADRVTLKTEEGTAETGGRDIRQRAFLKRFTVFNVDQCEGLPDVLTQVPMLSTERETIPTAEALIQATGADFRIGGSIAFYCFGSDYIEVPPRQAFRRSISIARPCTSLGIRAGSAGISQVAMGAKPMRARSLLPS